MTWGGQRDGHSLQNQNSRNLVIFFLLKMEKESEETNHQPKPPGAFLPWPWLGYHWVDQFV